MIECEELDPKPTTYLFIMRFLTFLSPGCSLVAIYCIIKYPANMHTSYRLNLFIYQLSSLLFDFSFSTVACAVIFFPMTMGYAAGLAAFIDANLYPLLLFVLACITSVDVAIIGMFFCRLQLIIPGSHILRLNNKGCVLFMVSLYIAFPGSILFTGAVTYANVVGTKASFEEQFTCASAVMSYVTDAFDYWTLLPIVLNISALTTVYAILAVVLASKSFSTMKKATNLSYHMKSLQRKFLVRLYFQGLVPVVFFTAPTTVILSIIQFTIVNSQSLGNVCMCMMASYGLVSGVMVLVLNKPYYMHLTHLVMRKRQTSAAATIIAKPAKTKTHNLSMGFYR